MTATRAAQDTARDAVQIFGGRGITKTGMGRMIEHVRMPAASHLLRSDALPRDCSITGPCRSTRFWAEVSFVMTLVSGTHAHTASFIAEDVLGDLGVRQAIKAMPKGARL